MQQTDFYDYGYYMAIRIGESVVRPVTISLTVNEIVVSAYAGETIATVLFAENNNVFYRTRSNQPRAPFCNMGTCFECLVNVKFENKNTPSTWVRACMTPAEEGMVITAGSQIDNTPPIYVKD
jgi:D-hydroxyproline dehydrogenase subunit gamma